MTILRQFFLIFYELAQLILFFILNIISYLIKSRKLNSFLALRSPHNFYQNIIKAQNNYKNKDAKIYWIHVSSAGEMEQAIPVARKLHDNLGVYFFITYYSFSAEPFLKNFPAAIGSSGLPLDIRFVYNKLLHSLPITKIFFVRYDIWPALLLTCSNSKLEINLISATKIKTKKGLQAFISEKWNTLFYKYFSYIFVVSLEDLNYFKKLIPNGHIFLAGDAKWARANERAHSLTKTNNDLEFSSFILLCKEIKKNSEKKILVIGSPHSEEHDLVLQISLLKEKFFIIYVPHEVDQKTVQTLLLSLRNSSYNCTTYSELVQNFVMPNQDEINSNVDIVIIDKIGFLAEIYQVADAAIIGGGFDGQIHNVLEAAARGVPTLFGSSYSRAREASELIQANSALSFESVNNMFHFLSLWVNFKTEPLSSQTPQAMMAEAKQNALQLFQNIPDTSEVIFNAIKNKA